MCIFFSGGERTQGQGFLRYPRIRPRNKKGGGNKQVVAEPAGTCLETKAGMQSWSALKIAVSFERFEDIGKCSFITDLTRQITCRFTWNVSRCEYAMELENFSTSCSCKCLLIIPDLMCERSTRIPVLKFGIDILFYHFYYHKVKKNSLKDSRNC